MQPRCRVYPCLAAIRAGNPAQAKSTCEQQQATESRKEGVSQYDTPLTRGVARQACSESTHSQTRYGNDDGACAGELFMSEVPIRTTVLMLACKATRSDWTFHKVLGIE